MLILLDQVTGMLSACLCLPSNRCDDAAVQFLEVFRGNSQGF